jgi:hypothetical protein
MRAVCGVLFAVCRNLGGGHVLGAGAKAKAEDVDRAADELDLTLRLSQTEGGWFLFDPGRRR